MISYFSIYFYSIKMLRRLVIFRQPRIKIQYNPHRLKSIYYKHSTELGFIKHNGLVRYFSTKPVQYFNELWDEEGHKILESLNKEQKENVVGPCILKTLDKIETQLKTHEERHVKILNNIAKLNALSTLFTVVLICHLWP